MLNLPVRACHIKDSVSAGYRAWPRNTRRLAMRSMRGTIASVLVVGSFGFCSAAAIGDDRDPVDWSAYERWWLKGLPPATRDESRLKVYDPGKAISFLGGVALKWTRQNRCGTCHTNLPYLMARPTTRETKTDSKSSEIRRLLLAYSSERMLKPDEFIAMTVGPIASALALNDAFTTGKLDFQVRNLLDYVLRIQSAQGGWQYPTPPFLLPFLERDRAYLAYLVALGVGYAPGRYYEATSARVGFGKLQSFIRHHLPANAHDKAVLLWASVRTPGLLSSAEQADYENELRGLQNRDGGWTLPSMGEWHRHDGAPNSPKGESDGYATGLVTLVLCERGSISSSSSIHRAIEWLKNNQRVSGRWFTRSLYSDRFKNYLSNMGTAYALMAINLCAGTELLDHGNAAVAALPESRR